VLLCIVDLGVRFTDKVVAESVDTIGWVEEDQRPFSFPPTNELKHRLHIVLYCFTHLMVLDIDIILAEEAVILDIIGVITHGFYQFQILQCSIRLDVVADLLISLLTLRCLFGHFTVYSDADL